MSLFPCYGHKNNKHMLLSKENKFSKISTPVTVLHDYLTCPLHHSDIPIFWFDYHNDKMYVKVQEINNFVSVATCDRSVFLATKRVYARDSSITFLFY